MVDFEFQFNFSGIFAVFLFGSCDTEVISLGGCEVGDVFDNISFFGFLFAGFGIDLGISFLDGVGGFELLDIAVISLIAVGIYCFDLPVIVFIGEYADGEGRI